MANATEQVIKCGTWRIITKAFSFQITERGFDTGTMEMEAEDVTDFPARLSTVTDFPNMYLTDIGISFERELYKAVLSYKGLIESDDKANRSPNGNASPFTLTMPSSYWRKLAGGDEETGVIYDWDPIAQTWEKRQKIVDGVLEDENYPNPPEDMPHQQPPTPLNMPDGRSIYPGESVNIANVDIAFTENYVQTSEPTMATVGTLQTPKTSSPASPSYIWGSLDKTQLNYNYPNGWVLLNRTYQHVGNYPSGAYDVTDTYGYFQKQQPK